MPIHFNCRFAKVGKIHGAPWDDLLRIRNPSGGMTTVERVFAESSGGEIEIETTFLSGQSASRASMTEVWPVDLHEELQTVAANPFGAFPIPNLAVLFAPRYAPRDGVLGVMFDTGFIDEFNVGAGSHDRQVPREGCAVFIETIRSLRSEGDEFDAQVGYTVIHELAHVFNRQHTEDRRCFMDSSPEGTHAPAAASHKFLNEHRISFSQCAQNLNVQPGGAGFAWDNFDRAMQLSKSGLKLVLSGPKQPMYAWEPFELEVEVSLPAAAKQKSASIPDELDPAYRRFRIWIEEPSGERRLYRATKHYCDSREARTIRRGESFRRDISIFGQSGGYTFRAPGIYRIWATFVEGSGRMLRSKEVELCIKPSYLREKRGRTRLELAERCARAAGKVFFYRSGKTNSRHRAALEELHTEHRGEHLGSSATYALGRWYEHLARRVPRSRAHWAECATPLLRESVSNVKELLNSHRRQRAEECLQGLQGL
jgi:hypothetical protein